MKQDPKEQRAFWTRRKFYCEVEADCATDEVTRKIWKSAADKAATMIAMWSAELK
jgi:hypothetical protein